MKTSCLALALCIVPLAAAPADAALLTWTLNNVAFTDGGTATGSFAWDADTGQLGSYALSVSGGDTNTFSPVTYSDLTGRAGFIDDIYTDSYGTTSRRRFFNFSMPTNYPGSVARSLYLAIPQLLTNAGGTIALDITNPTYPSVECQACAPYRLATGGTLSAPSAVPEPATWGMMIAGFALVGGALRQRRRPAVAVRFG